MQIISELLPQAYLIESSAIVDNRGMFVKTYSRFDFENKKINLEIKEEYYSCSKKNVVRGMHFQVPPYDHIKQVYCVAGRVKDVLVDLRAGSNYGKTVSVELSENLPYLLSIPSGVAHGFKGLDSNNIMVYRVSEEYSAQHDFGVRWDSIDFDWGDSDSITVSERDRGHPALSQYKSPF
ncbi:dTDP-4-dehydrorhamnose 3,5-epimerase family protein [Polynucleobacter sp. Nonnen-W13]|uniref:dTDP-4-dehydrorhamnose 3,5-epimerase family protein n=1 Tax=Polynucleobacter sp. Nonnen-W13 TaxID=1855625 RepID=UPI001C0D4024|nr:dTDP-4-dehydrorhamnose 3,5-epimerase family protein [Polynucleobacter sp. Nonnen-W13]MBU3558356.1 dTDP-4-dehydrorhamnose 3,5-epimerase family protein [Polynucleobacter sp. Nonnen-W13]